ncbi:hypothetical protein CR203_07250 [Salipaludibacillus neizhouensis]|uniref:XdhC Rossmann domain-containing protein n=1 Tax=Salipaludibacillus neizhouensis TaxID=885475 RepID=A0A3A9KBW6_9BACI|nr:XdhC family protein [Salipaludibacillus neizhouensis]RKL68270.1 hypothetical protein CR203_07250 [Salipaludibacillus neizhouensis]
MGSILPHSFERDKFILQNLLPFQNELAYLGVLGPTRRTSRLLDGNPIPAFVSSPIGVDIYADGAEEISISVIAELIQVRNLRARQNFGNLVVC